MKRGVCRTEKLTRSTSELISHCGTAKKREVYFSWQLKYTSPKTGSFPAKIRQSFYKPEKQYSLLFASTVSWQKVDKNGNEIEEDDDITQGNPDARPRGTRGEPRKLP